MEAFSLLKYWRTTTTTTTGLTKSTPTTTTTDCSSSSATTTPIITTASPRSSTSSSDNDHGPYFDMEFALADQKEQNPLNPNAIDELAQENETEEDEDEEEEVEVSLRISSSSSSNDSSKEHSHSKIDENVHNSVLPIETSSLVVTSSDSTHKFSNNLLKSASKFRVLMALKLKKLKENAAEEGKKEGDKPETENNNSNNPTEKETHKRKFFTVKLIKVDEVPIVSLFTRDHSSKTENREGPRSFAHKNHDSVTERPNNNVKPNEGLRSSVLHKNPDSIIVERNNNVKANEDSKDEEDKRLTKDTMQKYLKMVKPLYVRASKRYGDKMRFSGQLVSFSGGDNRAGGGKVVVAASPPSTAEVTGGGEVEAVVQSVKSSINSKSSGNGVKERNFTAGLRVVLGKSKSASAVPVEAPPVSKRRDDSLIQQQDGIQSAIMHCKRSFNASRESPAKVVGTSSSKGQIV